MTLLNVLLVFLLPVIVGVQYTIAAVSFNGRPVRPSRRPVFARMVPAGGVWS
jgi:hypothetical protein